MQRGAPMRTLLFLAFLLSGCAISVEEEGPPAPTSVRERLEAPARLLVVPAASGGVITAERKVGASWEAGLVDLRIENGEVVVSTTSRGALSLDALQVSFAPLDLPAQFLDGHHVQITNLRLDLARPRQGATAWVDDDEVTLAADLDLQLTWQLAIDGSPVPLGSPRLPPVPVVLVLTGDGAHLRAELRLRAPGELWSWAGLLQLRDLTLVLGAAL